jgi:hypothetical protein
MILKSLRQNSPRHCTFAHPVSHDNVDIAFGKRGDGPLAVSESTRGTSYADPTFGGGHDQGLGESETTLLDGD